MTNQKKSKKLPVQHVHFDWADTWESKVEQGPLVEAGFMKDFAKLPREQQTMENLRRIKRSYDVLFTPRKSAGAPESDHKKLARNGLAINPSVEPRQLTAEHFKDAGPKEQKEHNRLFRNALKNLRYERKNPRQQ